MRLALLLCVAALHTGEWLPGYTNAYPWVSG